MDDNTPRLRAEFPLGTTLKIIASEPTPAQQLVLALTRAPRDGDGKAVKRALTRLFAVMETLVGEDTWYDVVEDALITEQIDEGELVTFCQDVLSFDWSSHRKQVDGPVETPEIVETPARPVPRVIDGA